MQNAVPIRVQLGAFELDLRAGELRKDDQRARLPGHPFQVLLMLVEASGDLVTREEIKKKLWPNDTVVEFDHGIHNAINRLRQALGDSADKPKYVETIGRRGYRLIVPVECLESSPGDEGPSPTPSASSGQALSPRAGEDGGAPAEVVQPEGVVLLGKKVSHYRVLKIIGGGGMGLVYAAEDVKLSRRVALKFLPEELADDPLALQRFEREARTASSLNHPNICYIHEFGEHEGQPFIAMELLEGETLRERLTAADTKGISLDELLRIGLQVCDGLKAAHEKGIIHRDIKPANIFLTTQGAAKILDFGLARVTLSEEELELSSRAEVAASATRVEGPVFDGSRENADPSTARPPVPQNTGDGEDRGRSAQDDSIKGVEHTLTRTGVAMGTAGYMSPEQVRARSWTRAPTSSPLV